MVYQIPEKPGEAVIALRLLPTPTVKGPLQFSDVSRASNPLKRDRAAGSV